MKLRWIDPKKCMIYLSSTEWNICSSKLCDIKQKMLIDIKYLNAIASGQKMIIKNLSVRLKLKQIIQAINKWQEIMFANK